MAKKNQPVTLERIVFGADRRSAQKLRKMLIGVIAKDKKSDGLRLAYTYRPFRKRAEYTLEGHPKTVGKCLKTFEKFMKKREKLALRAELRKTKAAPMPPLPKGKYYTLKPLKERKKGV